MNDRKHILLAIALLIVLAVLGVIMQRQIPPRLDLPFDTTSSILAVEFVQLPEEVNAVLGGEHRYAPEIRRAQYLDFVFIPCYVALFAITGLALRRYDIPAPNAAAWSAVICAVAAGALDIAENIEILKLAASPNAVGSHVRWFSLPKWGLVFLTMLIDSTVFFFWPKLDMWWRFAAVVVGGLFLFAGGAGLLFTLLVSIKDIASATEYMTFAFVAMLLFLCAFHGIKRKA
jgi:hypothetical protein